MNFEINVYFAKFLVCPRYLEYITHILSTEMRGYPKIDVRFYGNRTMWFDSDDLSPTEAIDFIKLKVAQLSTRLTPDVRQDFIDDFMFVGKC